MNLDLLIKEIYNDLITNNKVSTILNIPVIYKEEIIKTINKYNNLDLFLIGKNQDRIVLKINKDFNYEKSLESSCYIDYDNKKYDDCILKAKTILLNTEVKQKKPKLYYLLGKALIKNGKVKEGLEYLKISHGLIESKGLKSNLINLINNIENDNFEEILNNHKEIYEIDEKLADYINNKYLEMINNKLIAIILPENISERQAEIYNIVKNNSNMWCTKIYIDNVEHVILIKNIPFDKTTDYTSINNLLFTSYKNNDYITAIDCLNTVISVFNYKANENLADRFKMLGACYLKLKMEDTAFLYIKIAKGIYDKLNINKNIYGYNYLNTKKEYIEKINNIEKIIESDNRLAYRLEPVDSNIKSIIFNIIINNPNLFCFIINDNNPRLVIKPVNTNYTYTDYKNFKYMAHTAYFNQDYDLCIESARGAIKCEREMLRLAKLYKLLGKSYYKLGSLRDAIYYLEISKGIYDRYDKMEFKKLENFINFLKENIKDVDPFTYYIDDELMSLAKLLNDNLNIDELDLTEETKNIVYLILTRESYINENYDLGDSYLNIVNNSLNKSIITKNLIRYLLSNKYNLNSISSKKLVLK